MNSLKIYLLVFLTTSQILGIGLQTKPAFAQQGEKELFLVAQKAFEDGFYDVAIRYVEQLLRDYPQTDKRVQANLLLGQCYFFMSQYLKAYEIFQGLLAYSEFKDMTLFWLGETYLKGSDYKNAEQQYRQLIELFPESPYAPQAYYSLGWVQFEQENYEQAKIYFTRLISQNPLHQLAEDAYFKLGETEYNLRNYEEAINSFTQFVTQFPKSNRHADAYFYIAESHYYLKDPLTAVTYYAKTAEKAYDHKLILMAKVSMGWSYLKLSKYALAKENFLSALEFSKEKGYLSDDAYLGLAHLYTEMKEYQNALKAYNELIINFPESHRIAEVYHGKANSLYSLGRYDEAIEVYQSIIDQFSENKALQEIIQKSYFGLAWSQLKNNNIDQAVETFKKIQRITDNKTVKISALVQIGDAYQDNDRLDEAITLYDDILQQFPDSPYTDYVQYRQGVALLKIDRLNAATMSFQSLKSNFPDSVYIDDVNYYLAVAYFKKGQWFITVEHIHGYIDRLPANHEFAAESYNLLGLAEFNLKQYKDAIKTFQKIIKNFPSETSIRHTASINIAKSYYELKETSEALKRFKLIVDQYAGSDAAQEALIWLGDHYLENADYETAKTYYLQFLNDYPKSGQIHVVRYELGRAYEGLEQYDKAIETFKLINDPFNRELFAKAKLAIADIFRKNLKTDSAIDTYQSIIEGSPEFKRDAYVKIAEIHQNMKEYEMAIEAYEKALNSKMKMSLYTDAELKFRIGDSLELLRENDKAVELYLKITYLYPRQTAWVIKSYLRIAKIFENDEKWREASKIYNKIIDLETTESKFAQERLDWIKNNINPSLLADN